MSNKRKSRRSVIIYHNGVKYEVPSNHVRRFRQLMGAPKPPSRSLARNQWSTHPYRYED